MKTILLFLSVFLSVSLFGQNDIEYYNNGINHYEAGEYLDAIANFTSAIKINPGDADAYYSRGNAYLVVKKYQEAIDDYNTAVQINPGYADAYYWKGFTKDQLGRDGCDDYKQACILYQALIRMTYEEGPKTQEGSENKALDATEQASEAKFGFNKPGLIDTIDYQYQEWYPGRNQLKIEGMFDEHYKRHGKWVFYDKNGREMSMTTYAHNLKQGFSIAKHPNGVIYYRGEYNKDKKVGLWTFYNDKGEKVNEINYDAE